jgi:hypothetical protein
MFFIHSALIVFFTLHTEAPTEPPPTYYSEIKLYTLCTRLKLYLDYAHGPHTHKAYKVRSPIQWIYGGFYLVYYKDVGEFQILYSQDICW